MHPGPWLFRPVLMSQAVSRGVEAGTGLAVTPVPLITLADT